MCRLACINTSDPEGGQMLIQIILFLLSIWAFLLLLAFVSNARGHLLRDRSMAETVIIELVVWIVGTLLILAVCYAIWAKVIPDLEKQQAETGQQVVLDFTPIRCLLGGCDAQPTPTSDPDSTPTPQPTPGGPTPTPSSRDQLVRDYRGAFGKTECVFTADSGDDGGANIVALADARGVRCLVIAGDVIYPNGSEDNFHKTVESFLADRIATNDTFPGAGNHDWWRGYPDNLQLSWTADELPLCKLFPYLPQGQGKCRYYRVLLSPDVEVIHFDSDYREPDGNTTSSVQGQWLQAALSECNSAGRWCIVVTHEPPVSSCNHEPSAAVAALPLLDWGADVLVAGHCHQYERSDVNGLPVFVVGVGGQSRYQFERNNPFSQFRYRDGQGALFLSANAVELKLEFVTTAGETIDNITLTKATQPTSPPSSAPDATLSASKQLMTLCRVYPVAAGPGWCFAHAAELNQFLTGELPGNGVKVGVLGFSESEVQKGIGMGAQWVAYNPEPGHTPDNELNDILGYSCKIVQSTNIPVIVGPTYNTLAVLDVQALQACGVDGVAVQLQNQLEKGLDKLGEEVPPMVGTMPYTVQVMKPQCDAAGTTICKEIVDHFTASFATGIWPQNVMTGEEVPDFYNYLTGK